MFIEQWKVDRVDGETVSRTLDLELLDSLHLPEVYDFIQKNWEILPRKEFFALEDEGTMFKPFIEGGLIAGLREESKLVAMRYVTFPRNGEHPLADALELTAEERVGLVYLKATMVDPAYRGNGLQHRLTEWMMNYAGLMGYDRFMATIHPENVYSLRNMLDLGLGVRGLAKMYPNAEHPDGMWRLMLYGDRREAKPSGDQVAVPLTDVDALQDGLAKGYVGVEVEDGKLLLAK